MSTIQWDIDPVIKIADFGLAKQDHSNTLLQVSYSSRLDHSAQLRYVNWKIKTICGTQAYFAPELANRNKDGYWNVVDCWSVGVITFLM